MPTKTSSSNLVAGILQGYADRGTFKGFSEAKSRAGKGIFKLVWHRDRLFEVVLDGKHGTLSIPLVLPEVPAESSMFQEFSEFIESRHSIDLPEHRRIDHAKSELQIGSRGGNISLTMTVVDGDYEYATRKLINAVHETYLAFLSDGRYYDYMLEKFELDPDHP